MKKKVLLVNEASYLNTGYAVYGKNLLNHLNKTGKYEVAELSVYGEEDDPKRASIPWKNYPNVPKNEEHRKIYESVPIAQFGAFRFERVLVDFKPTHVCFKPDALVMTEEGYKEISLIKKGERVLTHKNRFMPVTNTMRHTHMGEMISIKVNGMRNYLTLTPDHPVLIFPKKNQTNRKKDILSIHEDTEPVFVPAKDVKKGDQCVLPSWSEEKYSRIDITDYLDNFIEENDQITNNNRIHYLNRYITTDENFGRLCGYVIGDGHFLGNSEKTRGLHIYFSLKEKQFAEDAANIIKKYFGVEAKVELSKELENMWVCITYSSLLSRFFEKLVGYRYWNKKIPKEIIIGSKLTKIGLISGLIRSDGWTTTKQVSFSCHQKTLAYTYRAICNSLGICTTLYKDNEKVPNWTVSAYGKNGLLLDNISQKYEKFQRIDKIKRDTSNVKWFHKHEYMISSVNRVRKTNYEGQVYNLSVQEDESYVTEFCVHNCVFRDYWMDSFIRTSPYRKFFNWIWMPACDGYPQNEEWISAFSNADAVFSYSDWGADVIRKQGGGQVNVLGSASPCAVSDYSPIFNQTEHKAKYGLENQKIVGTVMRNQRRKLYPDLFKAFAQYLKETGDQVTYLLCHTSYPDNGWDFPKYLLENGVSNRVLFTYICGACNNIMVSHFNGNAQFCPKCHQIAATMPNVKNGFTDKQLAEVYNLMDLYVQYANCEGFGMPSVEAASCGIPIACVDYSAMSDIVRKVDGFIIPTVGHYCELETGCYRALPDNKAFVQILKEWLPVPTEMKYKKRQKTRELALKYYDWNITCSKWEQVIDDLPIKNWNSQGVLCNPPPFDKVKDIPINSDYITLLYESMWPEMIGSYHYLSMIRDLDNHIAKPSPCGYFNTDNTQGFSKYQPFDRKIAYDILAQKCNDNNFWERIRIGDIPVPEESWI